MQSFNYGEYDIQLRHKSVFVYKNGRKVFATSISDYLEFFLANKKLIDYLKIKAKNYEQPTK